MWNFILTKHCCTRVPVDDYFKVVGAVVSIGYFVFFCFWWAIYMLVGKNACSSGIKYAFYNRKLEVKRYFIIARSCLKGLKSHTRYHSSSYHPVRKIEE